MLHTRQFAMVLPNFLSYLDEAILEIAVTGQPIV
jgi:hypothetical protein